MSGLSTTSALVTVACPGVLVVVLLLLLVSGPVHGKVLVGDFTSINGLENSPLTEVQAVVGESVLLPCDVSPPSHADAPILVLFFYETKGTPIFSVDARGSSLYSGEQWSDREQLGDRGSLKVRPGQQGLHLTRLTEEDAGEYRCRVDFKSSPTRNLRIQLKIIVPPRHILVTSSWDDGRIVTGMIGPYPEGADVTLTCQVSGGKPAPSVTWWQAGSLLDDLNEVSTEQVTRNSLRLARLTRADLLRKLTCVASNSNMTAPLSTAVVIDIAFPPSSVRITSKSASSMGADLSNIGRQNANELPESASLVDVVTVRVNREEYLTCESSGSRPQATLVWKKNGRTLENDIQHQEILFEAQRSNGYSHSPSSSTLKVIPTLEDHKAVISCEAFSPKLPEEPLENEVTLNVLYQPQISMSFESNIPLANIEEGDPFAFECSVNANPRAGELQWARDGVPIFSNSSEGITITGKRLVITKSSRFLSGSYTCAAANSEGVTTSDSIAVKVKFAPVCSSRNQPQYGAGKKEDISITCWVDSHPVPLTFRWAFNRSTELIDISQTSYSTHGLSSTLNYLPHSELDFGSLLCWAANDVGLMKEPCVIHVVPAARPEGVRNCEVVNNSSMPRSVALVSCLPGWDGGLDQSFTLEVRESRNKHSRVLASVQHSPNPQFNMKGLKHDEEYLFIITAVNSRGTSVPVTLSYTTPSRASSTLASGAHTSDRAGWLSWTLFVAVVLGVLVTVSACLCAVIGLMKFKASTHGKSTAKIVYAGPIRACEDNEKGSALGSPTMIFCDKHESEGDDMRRKGSSIQTANSECVESFPTKEIDDLNNKDEKFRSSGSDIRISTPYGWNPDSGSTCEDSYFRNSGPYHINSLSPPPPLPIPPAPLASSDSFGGSAGSYSRPSSGSSRPSLSNVSTSGFSTSTVALQPDYLQRDEENLKESSCRTPLMREVARESAV